jgi:hypothetical protein
MRLSPDRRRDRGDRRWLPRAFSALVGVLLAAVPVWTAVADMMADSPVKFPEKGALPAKTVSCHYLAFSLMAGCLFWSASDASSAFSFDHLTEVADARFPGAGSCVAWQGLTASTGYPKCLISLDSKRPHPYHAHVLRAEAEASHSPQGRSP